MQTPDITKAMYVAFVQPIITCAVAFGAPITNDQETAIIGLSGSFSIALVLADALIRRARANNAAAIARSKRVDAMVEPTPPPALVLVEDE